VVWGIPLPFERETGTRYEALLAGRGKAGGGGLKGTENRWEAGGSAAVGHDCG